MINNRYELITKKELNEKNRNSILKIISGALLTLTLMSGCGKLKESDEIGLHEYENSVEILYENIDNIDLNSFNKDIYRIAINGTNLKDVSEIANYQNITSLSLNDNLITDISPLESIEGLKYLNISNNSISNINIEKFPNLESLYIEGNFRLYSQEIIDYCKENNIRIDITHENVEEVKRIKEILKLLEIDNKTIEEKERIIYKYVINSIKYDNTTIFDMDKAIDYNLDPIKYALEGKGICVNYAMMFKAMCDLSGINCYEIGGKSGSFGHGWNLIEIDGDYMLCDPTFAATGPFFKLSEDSYYNQSGKIVESYNKKHSEGMETSKGFVETNVRNNMARNELEPSPKINGEDLVTKVLLGILSGSVFLLSSSYKKRIKKHPKSEEELSIKSK